MSRALTSVGLFALYALATVMFFWPWLPHLSTSLIGPPGDNMQDFWATYYVAVAPRSGSFFFTNLIRFPEGTPLYYHSISYPKTVAIALGAKLAGDDTATLVLLHNLSLLVSFPLAGVGAFYLVRHLTGSVIGALVGGFIFAFNPAHIAHTSQHIGVSSIEFYPFFVLAYLLALERRSVRWLAGAVVFYALGGLAFPYHVFYFGYFIAFHTVYDAIRCRTFPTGWRLFAPIGCLAGAAVAMSPVIVPMVVGALTNPSVYAPGRGHDADLAAYVAFPPFHALSFLGEGVYWRMTANAWEGTAYLGLVNLIVIVWLLLHAPQRDNRLLAYGVSGMLVFGILASGDWLHVLGKPTIPMPDIVLSGLPLFRNVRGASRAVFFVYLFLAIVIAHAFSIAWRHRQRAAVRWGLTAAAALIVLDFYPAHAEPMTPVACSPGLVAIRDDPEHGFGVMNLPNGQPAAYLEGNYAMFLQTCHGRPICQGITSRDVVTTLRDRLETRDSDAQRRQLTEARVKYIVINHPAAMALRWRPEDGSREQYVATYPVVYDGPDMTILRVY